MPFFRGFRSMCSDVPSCRSSVDKKNMGSFPQVRGQKDNRRFLVYEIILNRRITGKPKVDVEVSRKERLKLLIVFGLLIFVASEMLIHNFLYGNVLATQEEVRVFEPSEDAYVSQLNSNSNYGRAEVISIRSFKTVKELMNHRIYMKFEIEQLGRESYVASATLRLYKYIEGGNVRVRSIEVKRVLEHWSEPSIDWVYKPSIAENSTDLVHVNGAGRWYEWNVTADVRSWVDDGTENYGFCLMDSKENSTTDYASVFYSREAAEMYMYRPKLEVKLGPEETRPKSSSLELSSASALIVGCCALLIILTRFWKNKRSLYVK